MIKIVEAVRDAIGDQDDSKQWLFIVKYFLLICLKLLAQDIQLIWYLILCWTGQSVILQHRILAMNDNAVATQYSFSYRTWFWPHLKVIKVMKLD